MFNSIRRLFCCVCRGCWVLFSGMCNSCWDLTLVSVDILIIGDALEIFYYVSFDNLNQIWRNFHNKENKWNQTLTRRCWNILIICSSKFTVFTILKFLFRSFYHKKFNSSKIDGNAFHWASVFWRALKSTGGKKFNSIRVFFVRWQQFNQVVDGCSSRKRDKDLWAVKP